MHGMSIVRLIERNDVVIRFNNLLWLCLCYNYSDVLMFFVVRRSELLNVTLIQVRYLLVLATNKSNDNCLFLSRVGGDVWTLFEGLYFSLIASFSINKNNTIIFRLNTTLFLKVKNSYMFRLAQVDINFNSISYYAWSCIFFTCLYILCNITF